MNDEPDRAAIARDIIDANLYMVLGTADAGGRPWVSPVYFAPAGYKEFLWVSAPEARHSRNLSARPRISIVIFDSRVPINSGQAVYMYADAEQVSGAGREPALEVFSRRSVEHGGRPFMLEDVRAPARLRLYRATATEQYVLDEDDVRLPVTL
jgi:hypothetical protein